jgi:hypothetical protein
MVTGQETESKLVMAYFVSVILEMIMCVALMKLLAETFSAISVLLKNADVCTFLDIIYCS